MVKADLEATYRIVTPAFIGGADPEGPAELRLPSIKGALRFWWRTLVWSKVGNDVKRLKAMEAAIFGSSDACGQSKVLLRIQAGKFTPLSKGVSIAPKQHGLHYLGYGILETRGNQAGTALRSSLGAGIEFRLLIRFSPKLDESWKTSVIDAIELLGACGGLGSRSRRGWGSLSLVRLRDAKTDIALRPLQQIVPRTFVDDAIPHWTAWSKESRVIEACANSEQNPLRLLDLIGRELVRYRCWGYTGQDGTRVLMDIASEHNFVHDHDLVKRQESGAKPWNRAPDRIAFGLPHNYFTEVNGLSPNRKKGVTIEPTNGDRRGSPLFLHVSQPSPATKPLCSLVFLPSRFLPASAPGVTYKIELRPRDFLRVTAPITQKDFWYPITAFLDRLIDAPQKVRPPYLSQFPVGKPCGLQEPLTCREILK